MWDPAAYRGSGRVNPLRGTVSGRMRLTWNGTTVCPFRGPTQIGNIDLDDDQSSCTVMAPDGQSSSASGTIAARSLGGAVSSTSTRPSSSPLVEHLRCDHHALSRADTHVPAGLDPHPLSPCVVGRQFQVAGSEWTPKMSISWRNGTSSAGTVNRRFDRRANSSVNPTRISIRAGCRPRH